MLALAASASAVACRASPATQPEPPARPAATAGVESAVVTTVDAATRRGGLMVTSRPIVPVQVAAPALQVQDPLRYPPPATTNGPLYPLAVMVDNHPDARPQSGLPQADVVYEALAEGGVSRFMAVYLNGTATSIGPVRSARHYFVNLAAELNASLVHIGSSPLGYEVLRAVGLRNLDETYGHPGFQRIRARPAPHNAYTSTDAARSALAKVRGDAQPGSWGGLRFKPDPAAKSAGREARGLSVEYKPWKHTVRFDYDPAANHYSRFMDGGPHRDGADGSQLAPTNVVVMTVPSEVMDAEGRLQLSQVGTCQ